MSTNDLCDQSAMIFDIQKFSIHDGPGIRTTVFLKGCPLHCLWCHNPESQTSQPELFFTPEKCTGCGTCVPVCPPHARRLETSGNIVFDRSCCTACGQCADVCPASALELSGKQMTVSEVLDCVRKDLPFYRNSGGGLTLSGGEPMMQFHFVRNLLEAAKNEGLDTAMETCGFALPEYYKAVLPLVDHFLFDIKTLDAEKHRNYTGVKLAPILQTLYLLDSAGAEISLRCPLIPGLNDSDDELREIAALAETLTSVHSIDLEPYHPLGVAKSRRLGKQPEYAAAFASDDYTRRILHDLGSLTKVPIQRA